MKYFFIIIILFTCCKTSELINSKKCNDLQEAVNLNWSIDRSNFVCYTNDFFLDSLQNDYFNSFLDKDTTYLLSVLGKNYSLLTPMFGKEKNARLAYSLEIPVSTKKNIASANFVLLYGIDSSNLIKYVKKQEVVSSRSY